MLMIDLCCGMKGASRAMYDAGWDVVTLDIDRKFSPDILADLVEWEYSGPVPDLIWASPPCTEFSRESMPWCRTGKQPDMTIALAAKRIIDQVKPKYWVIENVRGAIKHFAPVFGEYRASFGPFFLWGDFPIRNGAYRIKYKKKESYSSRNKELRATIPLVVSKSIMDSIVKQRRLF